MSELMSVVGTMALLGSAAVGGVFFAFSSFVMKALGRLPSTEGIASMQSINLETAVDRFVHCLSH